MHHFALSRPRRAAILLAVPALALTACSAGSDTAAAPADPSSPAVAADAALLAQLGLEGLDTREIIDTLDATALEERSEEFVASIRPEVLLLTGPGEQEASLPMPADAFYVSIAPYVDQTHECYFHSLTTCTGELQGEEIDITVVDATTGETLIEETRTTFDNGFTGLWLPRDIEATVTIEHDGLTATADLSTDDSEDATCVTTMQLT